jgi:hypothetical protein
MQIDIDLEKMVRDSLARNLNNDEEEIAKLIGTNGVFWSGMNRILEIELPEKIDFVVSKLVSHVCHHLENQE